MSSRSKLALLSGACFAGFVVVMTVRVIGGAVVQGGTTFGVLAALLILFGSTALVAGIVAIAIGVEGRLGRLTPVLKSRFPRAEVRRIYGEADFQIGLRALIGNDKLPPHFLLMVMQANAVDLFSATADVPLAHIEAEQIVEVHASTVLTGNGVPKPSVELSVRPNSADETQIVLRFLVMRGRSLSFMNVDMPGVQAVADRLGAIRRDARA